MSLSIKRQRLIGMVLGFDHAETLEIKNPVAKNTTGHVIK